MMMESGRIVAIESDCLWVETIRQSTCNSCSAQKGCGHSMLNKVSAGRRNHVRVLLGQCEANDFSLGESVGISVPEQVLVTGALLVYLLPLVSMLLSSILVAQWWPSDLATFAGAVIGFLIGVGAVRLHAYTNKNNADFQPVVMARSAFSPENPVKFVTPL